MRLLNDENLNKIDHQVNSQLKTNLEIQNNVEKHRSLSPSIKSELNVKKGKGRPSYKYLSKDCIFKKNYIISIAMKSQNNKKLTPSPKSDNLRRNSSRDQITLGNTRYNNFRNKNETDSKDSYLMNNFGAGGHRRTRNSLEDAILNAVLEQSVKGLFFKYL